MKSADLIRASEDAIRLTQMFAGLAEFGRIAKDLAGVARIEEEAKARLTNIEIDIRKKTEAHSAAIGSFNDELVEKRVSMQKECDGALARAVDIVASAEGEANDILSAAQERVDAKREEASSEEARAKAIVSKIKQAETKLSNLIKECEKHEARIAKAKAAAAAIFQE